MLADPTRTHTCALPPNSPRLRPAPLRRRIRARAGLTGCCADPISNSPAPQSNSTSMRSEGWAAVKEIRRRAARSDTSRTSDPPTAGPAAVAAAAHRRGIGGAARLARRRAPFPEDERTVHISPGHEAVGPRRELFDRHRQHFGTRRRRGAHPRRQHVLHARAVASAVDRAVSPPRHPESVLVRHGVRRGRRGAPSPSRMRRRLWHPGETTAVR